MRTIIAIGFIAATFAVSAQTVQELETEAAKLPALKASIYGSALVGFRELEPELAGKSAAEAHPIYAAAARPVRMGEQFQVTVQTVGGRNITANPRTKYAGTGCLVTSAQGFVTVSESIGPCRVGVITELWVSLVDGANPPDSRAWNRYAFRIVE